MHYDGIPAEGLFTNLVAPVTPTQSMQSELVIKLQLHLKLHSEINASRDSSVSNAISASSVRKVLSARL